MFDLDMETPECSITTMCNGLNAPECHLEVLSFKLNL